MNHLVLGEVVGVCQILEYFKSGPLFLVYLVLIEKASVLGCLDLLNGSVVMDKQTPIAIGTPVVRPELHALFAFVLSIAF
jgi:hypothetical protein